MSHAASAGVSLRARECNHPLEGKKCDQVHQSVMGGHFSLYGVGTKWLEAVCSHFSVAVDGT